MQPIVPNVFTFTGLFVGRVYLIAKGDDLTLIDASISSAGDKILAQLSAAGHAASDVKRILLTHAHPDHVGAVPQLIKATGAELIVPAGERAVVDGEVPIPKRPKGISPPETFLKNMKADRTLDDGDTLAEVLGGLQAVNAPGHTPGHTAYWQPERRILFCADTVMNTPRMRLPIRIVTVDMAENIRSIAKLAALDPEVICFGHGKPVTSDAAGRLRAFAAKVGAKPAG